MRTRLLEFGISWDDVIHGGYWNDVVAVLETEPPWGPLHRAHEPENWFWYVPGFDDLVNISEMVTVANGQRANVKKSQMPKRRERPWDKRKRKLKAAVLPIKTVADDFASRFAYDVNSPDPE